MKTHKLIYNTDTINNVAKELLELLPTTSIFTFSGPLGAGKTTLISTMLNQAKINCNILSPTFTYLNIYNNAKNQKFYHFDLYRINPLEDSANENIISSAFNEESILITGSPNSPRLSINW